MERRASQRLDPKLGGNLPPEVLVRIYQALPIRDFYKLRGVCKEWNNVACERRCLSDSVRIPYFVLIRQGHEYSPTGTLAYNASSGRWIWRLHSPGDYTWHQIGHLKEPFVVEGIFFEGTAVWEPSMFHPTPEGIDFTVGVPQNSLFDVQTDKDFSAFQNAVGLRRIPEVPQMEGSILGMMVDTSRSPTLTNSLWETATRTP